MENTPASVSTTKGLYVELSQIPIPHLGTTHIGVCRFMNHYKSNITGNSYIVIELVV